MGRYITKRNMPFGESSACSGITGSIFGMLLKYNFLRRKHEWIAKYITCQLVKPMSNYW